MFEKKYLNNFWKYLFKEKVAQAINVQLHAN